MASPESLTELRQAVDGLTEQLRESGEDRSALHGALRLRTWVIGGLLALLAAAAIGIGLVAEQAHSASNDAKAASSRVASIAHTSYEACLTGNQFRADTKNLWDAVIGTLQPLTVSPMGRQFVADIQHDVDLTTAPRVCKPA